MTAVVEKMNPEVKALWLAALRGGGYNQAKGYLRRTYREGDAEGFCCLGILCEIAVQQGVIAEPVKGRDEYAYTYGQPCTCGTDDLNDCAPTANTSVLPAEVAAWASIGPGGFRGPDKQSLAGLNDNGKPFAEIADIIEAEF